MLYWMQKFVKNQDFAEISEIFKKILRKFYKNLTKIPPSPLSRPLGAHPLGGKSSRSPPSSRPVSPRPPPRGGPPPCISRVMASHSFRGSFSTGSTPIFASKYAFFSINVCFQDLQENHLLFFLFSQSDLQKICKISQKFAKILVFS